MGDVFDKKQSDYSYYYAANGNFAKIECNAPLEENTKQGIQQTKIVPDGCQPPGTILHEIKGRIKMLVFWFLRI